jgi:DnaJ-class molecular chaperone
MSSWLERKEERRMEFARRFGVKEITCTACSGSGVYDHNGCPPCGGCDGKGKTRDRLNTPEQAMAILASLMTR